MNLLEIKELLGHRSIRMTLQYAAVTQDGIRNSYFKAIEQIGKTYVHKKLPHETAKIIYTEVLNDLVRELRKTIASKQSKMLIKRIQKIRTDLKNTGIS